MFLKKEVYKNFLRPLNNYSTTSSVIWSIAHRKRSFPYIKTLKIKIASREISGRLFLSHLEMRLKTENGTGSGVFSDYLDISVFFRSKFMQSIWTNGEFCSSAIEIYVDSFAAIKSLNVSAVKITDLYKLQ